MKKSHKIVMLPTKELTHIVRDGALHQLCFEVEPDRLEGDQFYHLYILSDDEIKYEDWYLETFDNEINKLHEDSIMFDAKKIIATTNSKLVVKHTEGVEYMKHIPQIPNSFLESYTEEPVEEVELEYEAVYSGDPFKKDGTNKATKLKLINNEVVVAKESLAVVAEKHMPTYSKEQVEHLCRSAYNEGVINGVSSGLEGRSEDQWVKDKL